MIFTRDGYEVLEVQDCHDMIRGTVLYQGCKKVLHWYMDGRLTPACETPFDLMPEHFDNVGVA